MVVFYFIVAVFQSVDIFILLSITYLQFDLSVFISVFVQLLNLSLQFYTIVFFILAKVTICLEQTIHLNFLLHLLQR